MEKLKIQSAVEKDLPGYRIDSILGSGATSTVYRAVQISLGRYVAIKRFDPATFMPETVSSRFEREAAIWSHLGHENLIHLYDYQRTENARYIILEYCHGIELREAIDRVITFPPTVVAAIGYQLLSALEYLHPYNVIHRDLKPANIFLTHQGVVKLMDFGISLCPELEPITAPGQIMGTPAYMSPEQVLGKEITDSSDFFSLGVVLYEILNGVKPFKPSSFEQMLKDKDYWEYKTLPRAVPRALRNFVYTCLQKKIQKRNFRVADQKATLEDLVQREGFRSPRERIQSFLTERNLVEKTESIFFQEAIKETYDGPLAETFSRMIPNDTWVGRRRSLRIWLMVLLLMALLLGAYFGPYDQKPEWGSIGELVRHSCSKVLLFFKNFKR